MIQTVPFVGQSFLSHSYPEQARDGITASFHPDGQLHQLCLFYDHDLIMSLEIDGRGWGHAGVRNGAWENYSDGRLEVFHQWSDSGPEPCDYLDWVRRWIATIEATACRRLSSPIVQAVIRGDLSALASVTPTQAEIERALDVAVERGQLDLVSFLMSRGANAGVTSSMCSLRTALRKGHSAIALAVLERRIPSGALVDPGGVTLVMNAAEGGCIPVIQYLLARGHDLQAMDKWKLTPFHHAIMGGQSATLTYLVGLTGRAQAPADLLHYSPVFRHPDCVRVLVDHGWNVDGRFHRGCAPLHLAGLEAKPEAVELLLASGANPWCLNADGRTPREAVEVSQKHTYNNAEATAKSRIIALLEQAERTADRNAESVSWKREADQPSIVVCSGCKAKNRIPSYDILHKHPVCGKCGARLL